jgi:alpha-ketoglutarate-dependent taurine dioxygenase
MPAPSDEEVLVETRVLTLDGPVSDQVVVTPCTGVIGAEISGVDLGQPLAVAEVNAIKAALRRWRVVFFRDQDLNHASHVALGRQFGQLTYAHPYDDQPPDGYPEIYTLTQSRLNATFNHTASDPRATRSLYISRFHEDLSAAVNPPAASILRAESVPSYGGDTLFVSLVDAFNALSPQVQGFLESLRAEHLFGAQIVGASAARMTRDYLRTLAERPFVAHHPVVRVHPETKEKTLMVNALFTGRILDVSASESQWILDFLFRHMASSEFGVRFKWEPGSVAFWENRLTLHYGPVDDITDPDRPRIMHRINVAGDIPFGVDGTCSQLIEGKPLMTVPATS